MRTNNKRTNLFPSILHPHRRNWFPITTSPVPRINARPNPPMKRGVRPVNRATHVTVFDRIPVHVIEMGIVIPLLFNRVFPEPSLPHAPPSTFPTGTRRGLLLPTRSQIPFSKLFLDPRPPRGIPVISRRQRPDRMQVIGQQHHGGNRERPSLLGFA